MSTYRISDEATSEIIAADNAQELGEKYFANYDTAEMAAGETFRVRVFMGADLMDHEFDFVAEADGRSGVSTWE